MKILIETDTDTGGVRAHLIEANYQVIDGEDGNKVLVFGDTKLDVFIPVSATAAAKLRQKLGDSVIVPDSPAAITDLLGKDHVNGS